MKLRFVNACRGVKLYRLDFGDIVCTRLDDWNVLKAGNIIYGNRPICVTPTSLTNIHLPLRSEGDDQQNNYIVTTTERWYIVLGGSGMLTRRGIQYN